MKKLLLLFTLVVGVIAIAMPGQAATLHFGLDTVFPGTPLKPIPYGSAPWVTVDFDDGDTPGTVDMRISANLQHSVEFVGSLYLNSNTPLDNYDFSSPVSSGGFTFPEISPEIYTTPNSQKADGDGWYDFKFEFSTSDGNTFNNTEWLEYTITATGLTADSFNLFSTEGGGEGIYLAAAHIQDADGIEDNGTWVGAVPIPASVLLLGSGLIGLAGFKRKIAK